MNSHQEQGSHLFLVRFWSEGVEEAGEESLRRKMRGRVQHVLSGEARAFHDWPTLIDLLLEMAETDSVETKAQEGGM